jgi:hypothetical protein
MAWEHHSVAGRQFCGATASTQEGGSWRRVSTSSGQHRKRPRERKGESGRAVLTLGRRCSRGRLGEDGRRGVVVHGVDVPTPLLPPCVDVSVRSLLSSGSLVMDGAQVSSVRRGRRAPSSSSPSLPPSPPSPLSAVEQRIGGNPQVVGGEPAGVRPRDEDTGSRRPEGKEATAPRDWAPRWRWRCGRPAVAATAPFASPAGAKEGSPLANWPPDGLARARRGSACAPARPRPSHLSVF